MAVLPLLVDLAETLSEPSIFDDDFGFGVHPYELSHYNRPRGILMTMPKRRPTPYSICKRRGGKLRDVPNVGKDGFQVCMHVEEFKPSELTVKTVDNCVVVEGKHEEREDGHGSISRHFVRKYSLPKGYDPSEVVSTLSSDGVLTVKAPPPPKKDSKQKERVIHIQHTGPAHLSVKDNSTESHNAVANGDKAEDTMES